MDAKEKYKTAKSKAGNNFHQIRPAVHRTAKDKAKTRQALSVNLQKEIDRYDV